MIILIAGASHTGKTQLAQQLLERYRYPVLSLDLLKMGLIRSGQTELTPHDDEELTDLLWSIASEVIKTAIENEQNLIVEGCYIPFGWRGSFEETYLERIEYCCLAFTRNYIEQREDDIIRFANVAERRLTNDFDTEEALMDNERAITECSRQNLHCQLIESDYNTLDWHVGMLADADLRKAAKLFHDTVRHVNAHDYAEEQLRAWSPGDSRHHDEIVSLLSRQFTVGVKECGILIGFGSLNAQNELDMLFVHKDRQRQGIASVIADELERAAAANGATRISAFSSITALPFFEARGYVVIRENTVTRRGAELSNFLVRKTLQARSAHDASALASADAKP